MRLILTIMGMFLSLAAHSASAHFRLWSPDADSVRVNIYKVAEGGRPIKRVMLNKQTDGWWQAADEDYAVKGMFFAYQIHYKGAWLRETTSPEALAVGVNGKREAILNMAETHPEGWTTDHSPAFHGAQNAVIYEMHHRDFSIDEQSGITHKGKFLALTETGTHNEAGLSTGLDHLKELGITHVHLLPSFDYGSIDETGKSSKKYNWGYDPVNYNVPEGSYSTNPYDPAVRIREFKQMVMALHKAGIRVVMDVVYNHVFSHDDSPFQLTAPGRFFRYNADGTPANGSGCGNETASEREWMRNYIINSVKYWMTEYHIDGFRFDLMGLHDIETMNLVRTAAQKIDPDVLLYGEGWAASSPTLPEETLAMKANTAQLNGIAAFGDEFRDGLRGTWSSDDEGAFAVGVAGNEESVKFGIVGAISHPQVDISKVNYSKKAWAAEPMQMIAYVSCHDDLCITDRLLRTKGPNDDAKRILLLCETALFTSQGVPFLWCGDEMMRDRKGVHNCYESPDSVNAIPWINKTKHKDVFDYVKGLIALRKAHPAFRMGKAELVRANLDFLPTGKRQHNVVAFHINGKAVGDSWEDIIVILNANRKAIRQILPSGGYTAAVYDGMINVSKPMKGKRISVPAQSALILYK